MVQTAPPVTMGPARALEIGKAYSAECDGMLFGSVGGFGDATKKCMGMIAGWAQGIGWTYATGGNSLIHFDGWFTFLACNQRSSFSVPIRKGTPFSTSSWQIDGRGMDATIAAWFIPFEPQVQLSELSQGDMAALGVDLTPPALINAAVEIQRQSAPQ